MLIHSTLVVAVAGQHAPTLGVARYYLAEGTIASQDAAETAVATDADRQKEEAREQAAADGKARRDARTNNLLARQQARELLRRRSNDPGDPGSWTLSYIPPFDPAGSTGYDYCQHIQSKANRSRIGMLVSGGIIAGLGSAAVLATPILLARSKNKADAALSETDMGSIDELRSASDKYQQASLWIGVTGILLGGVATFLIVRGKAAQKAQGRAISALSTAATTDLDAQLKAYAECLAARAEWALSSSDATAALGRIQGQLDAEAKARFQNLQLKLYDAQHQLKKLEDAAEPQE